MRNQINKLSVSVALATYNGEKYIEEQLNSLLSQTHLPDEIVISDNGSTDNTTNICERVLSQSSIKYKIINCQEKGVVANFENAAKRCYCDLIFFCDQDDIWYSDKIQLFLGNFEKDSKCVLVFSDANMSISGNCSLIRKLFQNKIPMFLSDSPVNKSKFLRMELYRNYITGMSCAVKKSYLKSIMPLSRNVLHDYWLAINAPFYGNVYYINEPTAYYRQHDSNVISHSKKITLSNFKQSVIKDRKYIYQRKCFLQELKTIHPKIERENIYSKVVTFNSSRLDIVDRKNIKGFLRLLLSGNYKYDSDKYCKLKDFASLFICVH